MSPEQQAKFDSPEFQKLLAEKQAAEQRKDWEAAATLFFKIGHFGLPKDDFLNQLYDGSNFLTSGAAEAKDNIEESIKLLAADYEFTDLLHDSSAPNRPEIVATLLFKFIEQKEGSNYGIMSEAVKYVREGIQHYKDLQSN